MSNVTLKAITNELQKDWNNWVDASENGTLYHYHEWLMAMENHSATKLIPLVIYRGKNIAGIFPVFLKKTTFLNFIFSPPPGCAVPYLGPAFLPQDLKTKDRESFRLEVIKAFEAFCKEQKADFIRISSTLAFKDTRPFLWAGFSAKPQYEYRINLQQEEKDVLASFQSETRTKIRRAQKYEDLQIVEASQKGYGKVFRLTSDRYREQGVNWLVSESYVNQLLQSAIAGRFQTWVAQYQGKTVTGLLSFRYRNGYHEWIGGINPAERIAGVNELLHWTMIQAARNQSCTVYDLGGANTPHLSRPKSKYSPEAYQYFEFKKRNFKSRMFEPFMQMGWMKKFYKQLRNRSSQK